MQRVPLPWMRIALVLAGVLLLSATWRFRSTQHTQLVQLEEHLAHVANAERRQSASEQLLREVDPARRDLLVSRALIADTLDPSSWVRDSEDTLATSLAAAESKLDLARTLADTVLLKRPRSWRANLYTGASIYLNWSMLRDERLVREAEVWREPLARALESAPHQREPKTFLALSQLELWQMLSPERRAQTRDLLAEAWSSGPLDRRILTAWLRVGERDESILEPLGNDPTLLYYAQLELAAQSRWDLVLLARKLESDAVLERIEGALHSARQALALGNLHLARAEVLAATPSPPSVVLAQGFDQLLAILPPGPVTHVAGVGFGHWLRWALDLDLYDAQVLEPSTLRRLEALAAELNDEDRLRARLVNEGPMAAERLREELAANGPPERNSDLDATGASGTLPTYRLQLVRHALERGNVAVAGTDRLADLLPRLGEVAPEHRVLRRYLQNALSTGSPRGQDLRGVVEIGSWQKIAANQQVAEVWLEGTANELTLPSLVAPVAGTAIDVSWDQTRLGSFERFASQPSLRLTISAGPGLHRISVITPYGGDFEPGVPELRQVSDS